MGIPGLKRYVKNNGFLIPYKLKSTRLIVDGNGIALLLSQSSDVDPRFGGDYNVMYDKMYGFFDRLLKSDVTPIVVLDGRFKEEKEATIKTRAETNFKNMEKYNQNFNVPISFSYYLFKTEVFLDVLKNLKIFVCRADFEADEEIIELARKINCPVLSNDYDFCLCDLIFIPWEEELLKGECVMFDREKFLERNGISLSVLPLIPVLVNDDYFQFNALDAVLKRKINFKYRCQEALKWLRNKDFQSARKGIITALGAGTETKRKVDFVVESYTNPKVTLDSTLRQNGYLQGIHLNIQEDDIISRYGVPIDIAIMIRECRLPNLMLDMITHREFYCRTNSVEYLKRESVHAPSKRLISGIYGLLVRNRSEKPSIALKIRKDENTFEDENVEEIQPLAFSSKENLEILYEIFELGPLEFFDNDWFVFVLAFKYWEQECKIEIALAHSVLLTAFSLNLMKSKDKFKISHEKTISYYLRTLDQSDKIKITKSDNKILKNISHLHMYLTFQQCLFYTIQIVKLLGLPNEIKISEFINGGFFHSFFTSLEAEPDFIKIWFDGFEKLEELYCLIVNKLELI